MRIISGRAGSELAHGCRECGKLRISTSSSQAPLLPCLRDLPGVTQESDLAEQKLEADYYDTSDLRLVRAGVTLRRRHGGGDAGWHLKLPLEAVRAARSACRSAGRAGACPPS